jgi:hypothetical protein
MRPAKEARSSLITIEESMKRFPALTIVGMLILPGVGALAAQDSTPPKPAPEKAPAAADSAAAKAPVVADSTAAAAPAKAAVTMPAPTEFQRRLAEVLLRGITLTAEQKSKLDGLMASHRADRAVFGTAAPDSATMVARVALVRKHMAENRAVLTEEQQKIYDRNLAQLREILTP